MVASRGGRDVVVFDFGGVLLDWNPARLFAAILSCGEDTARAVLEEIGFLEWNAEIDRGRPFAEAVEDLARAHPRRAPAIRAYGERWAETIGGPIPGSIEILESLDASGIELYGLSNWSAETFARVRPRYPFFDRFRRIVLSGDVGLIKPDPRIFRVLLERIGRPAGECLLIDDNDQNVATAHRLGFRTIRFTTAAELAAELHRMGFDGR